MKKICILGSGYLGKNLYLFLNKNINNLYEIYLQPIREKIMINLKDFDIIIDTADRARGTHNEIIKKKLDTIRTDKQLFNIIYIYFSSIQIYSDLLNFVDENSEISSNNEYQLNKTHSEKLIINNKNKYAILRLPNIWSFDSPQGTFMGDQIIKLKESLPIKINKNDFESFIDLVYIDDLFQIIIDLIKKTTLKELILNITTGSSLRISYIKECFIERKRMKLLKNNNCKFIFSTKKIRDLKFDLPLDFCHYYNKKIVDIYNEIDGK